MKMVGYVLHMAGGTGNDSYSANSTLQRRLLQGAFHVVKKAVDALVHMISSSQRYVVVADLGCSTGDNALFIFSEIADSISKACAKLGRKIPEIQLFLNDLPGNDFNTLLGPVLSSYMERMNESVIRDGFMPFYAAAVPGSFYKGLFPSSSVHFINSSSSLHWLSQVPPGLNNGTRCAVNEASIYISERSAPIVPKLYLEQFQRDFSLFLKHRSEELCPEGRMCLTLFGRRNVNSWLDTAPHVWIDEALQNLVSKGLLKASDVASFYLPHYFPTLEEVKLIIQKEASFDLVQSIVIESSYSNAFGVTQGDAGYDKWEKVVLTLRAALGTLLASHFGNSIMDEFYSTLTEVVSRRFHECDQHKWINIAVSLKKRDCRMNEKCVLG